MEVTAATLAIFRWLEASHRSSPHSRGGDHTGCEPQGAGIIGSHLRVCLTRHLTSIGLLRPHRSPMGQSYYCPHFTGEERR